MTVATAAPCVEVFFDLSATGGDFFTLDDATKGELDAASYPLSGDVATDITASVYGFSTDRGRQRELDEFAAGVATVRLRNYSGDFTPIGLSDPYLRDPATGEILTIGGDPVTLPHPYGADNITVGKRVRISTQGVVVFDGTIEDWDYSYDVDGTVDAQFSAADQLADLAAIEFDAWTATSGQTAGPRLTAALDRGEVNYSANRDFDDGVSTLQGDAVSWGSNVLNYCQLVAKSDMGRLFASRDGVLTFRDRHSLIAADVKAAFADDGSGNVSGFHRVAPAFGSELLFNRVGVDREGGTLQTADNATSQAKYRVRSLSLSGLLLDSDEQAANMAEYMVNRYAEPEPRIESLEVNLAGLPADEQARVVALDIGDVVSIQWTPTGAVAWSSAPRYIVEGVSTSHPLGGPMTVSLTLSPLVGAAAFVLDDSGLGVLDTGALTF